MSAVEQPRRRWLMLVLAWAALVLASTDRSLWSVTAPIAARSLGLEPTTALSAFTSSTQIGYIVALLVGSVAADRLGPRRIYAAALSCLGGAVLAFSTVGSVVSGTAAQFMIGVGAALLFALGLKLVVDWFEDRWRTAAISFFMTALSIPTVLVNLLAPIGIIAIGWRGNYRVVGAATLLVALLCFALVRSRAASRPAASATLRPGLRDLFANRDFRWLVVANMAAPWASAGLLIWSNMLLIDKLGIDLQQSGRLVASYGAGSFIALLIMGPIVGRLGLDRRRTAAWCMIAFGTATIMLPLAASLQAMTLAMPLLGFLAYAFAPPLNTMIAVAGGRMAASAAGLATILTFAAEAAQPWIVGGAYRATSSFALVCLLLAAGPWLAAIAVSRVRSTTLS